MKIIDLDRKKVESIDINTSTASKPTVIRCHPKRPDIIAAGLENGKIYFLNLRSTETFVFDAADRVARVQEKAE